MYQIRKKFGTSVSAARAAGATIGDDVRLYSDIATNEPWLVTIGDRVTISSGVRFVTHDGSGWLHRTDGRKYRIGRISIGSDVFIGLGSIIMPSVSVGDRCVIGSGSVVTKSVPEGFVVAGNPARIVSTYDEFMMRVAKWPSENEMVGSTRREQVDSIVESEFRPMLLDQRERDVST